MPNSRIIFAAGPFTAAPPIIGDTATTGNVRAFNHARIAGTRMMGAMLTKGLDGHSTTASTARERINRCNTGGTRAARTPAKRNACTRGAQRCRTK